MVLREIRLEDVVEEVPNLEEPGSPYQDSSDEYSYDENSDGESVRWKSMENRYDNKAPILVFLSWYGLQIQQALQKSISQIWLEDTLSP
jgi:predicted RNA-binding protein with PUA-like domain